MATITLTINGVERTYLSGSLRIDESLNSRGTASLIVLSTDGTYRPVKDQEVIVTLGSTRLFGGLIHSVRENAIGGETLTAIENVIECVDFNVYQDWRNVINGGFPAGTTLLAALTSLNGYLSPNGVSVHGSQATGPNLPLLLYDVRTIASITSEITQLTGYIVDVDYDKIFSGRLPGQTPSGAAYNAPFNITNSNDYAVGDVTLEPVTTDLFNTIIGRFGTGAKEVIDNFTGNGVQTAFTLNYFPLIAHRGIVNVGGTVVDGEITGGTNETLSLNGGGGTWDYDPSTGIVTRTSAVSNGVQVYFQYTSQFPVTITSSTGGSPVRELVIDYPDIFDRTTAAAAVLADRGRLSAQYKMVRYRTLTTGLRPGMVQTITRANRNFNASCYISELSTQHIEGELFAYDVVAIEGTQLQNGWQEIFREWAGGVGGGGSTGVGGTVVVPPIPGPGGAGGTGTAGTLAKWTTASTLGNSIVTESGSAISVAGTVAATSYTGTWLGNAIAAARGGTGLDTSASSGVPSINSGTWVVNNVLTNNRVLIAASGNTISSSANLTFSGTTLTVSDTIAAPANLALAPAGDLILNPTGNDVLPTTNYDINLGMLSLKYLTLHAAELWVETLVAQNTLATIGGRILVAPTTLLSADLAAAATTITVKHNNLNNGDRIYMESDGKVEFMAVTSGAGGSAGAYTYSVTRNLDGSGANDWFAGDAVLNTGTTGNGFIDLYSVRGVKASSEIGPTIVGNVRLSGTYNDWAPRWAIGNLDGLYGYSGTTYGTAFGDPSAANICIDATNGVRIRQGTTVYALLASSVFRIGASGGNRLEWNNSTLTVVSEQVTIDNSGIRIAAPPTSYTDTYSYRFTASGTIAGASFGIYAQEPDSVNRYIAIRNIITSNDKTSFIALSCQGNKSAGGSTVGSITVSINANTDVSSILLAASSVSVGADSSSSITVQGPMQANGVITASGALISPAHIRLDERSDNPGTPASGTQAHYYMKADKIIYQYNHAGTVRYYYLDLTSQSGTWTHTTTAP